MDRSFYQKLADQSLERKIPDIGTAGRILDSDQIELMPLLNAAYEVRKHFVGKDVSVHIINNAQNGFCPEDCHYCAQAKTSEADIEEYPIKSDKEILAEAKNAYEKGAHRYCMVFAGRGPSKGRVDHLANLIRKIKSNYPVEVCVSAGLLDEEKARVLKEAGLDRLNHNLNTSKRHYPTICTTHTYQDRLNTLKSARKAGLQLCSGVILGMNERTNDILETAYTLREIGAESIPVNFFIPIEGTTLENASPLNPEYCLRALCLYRFFNPTAEIRIAAGRELHLRSMEVMALYPANSLFMDGYLNARGAQRKRTLQMIKDAGFTVRSELPVSQLIANESDQPTVMAHDNASGVVLKDLRDLRPQISQ